MLKRLHLTVLPLLRHICSFSRLIDCFESKMQVTEEARLDAALEASQNELSLVGENAVASLGESSASLMRI